ncbi:MAG: hypothetical protein PHP70_07685 [Gallionella sp.]|nr:hypothetical protein [Gallionella sp.]
MRPHHAKPAGMPYVKHDSICSVSFFSSLLLGAALFFPLQLLGAEQPVSKSQESFPQIQEPTVQPPQSDRFDSMEAPRNYLSGKITQFASDIDRFFGGDRHFQESNPSVIQFSVNRADGYGGDSKFDLAAKLNLRLPVTEGRLRLLLETDPEKNITSGPTPAPTPTQGHTVLSNKVVVPKSVALAVRLVAEEENAWHFSTDAGLKFPLPIQPFMRTRASFSAPMGQWRLKAAESVYWFNSLGVGETTQLDLERIFSPRLLFRASSNATWLNDKRNFDLRQDLSVYHTLNDRAALMYQASVIGVSNPQLQATEYVMLAFYRYRLHQKWLFFELTPQLHFPRVNNYRSSPAISMRLEMLFDDSR